MPTGGIIPARSLRTTRSRFWALLADVRRSPRCPGQPQRRIQSGRLCLRVVARDAVLIEKRAFGAAFEPAWVESAAVGCCAAGLRPGLRSSGRRRRRRSGLPVNQGGRNDRQTGHDKYVLLHGNAPPQRRYAYRYSGPVCGENYSLLATFLSIAGRRPDPDFWRARRAPRAPNRPPPARISTRFHRRNDRQQQSRRSHRPRGHRPREFASGGSSSTCYFVTSRLKVLVLLLPHRRPSSSVGRQNAGVCERRVCAMADSRSPNASSSAGVSVCMRAERRARRRQPCPEALRQQSIEHRLTTRRRCARERPTPHPRRSRPRRADGRRSGSSRTRDPRAGGRIQPATGRYKTTRRRSWVQGPSSRAGGRRRGSGPLSSYGSSVSTRAQSGWYGGVGVNGMWVLIVGKKTNSGARGARLTSSTSIRARTN